MYCISRGNLTFPQKLQKNYLNSVLTKNFLGSFPKRKKKLLKISLNIEINQESDEILDLMEFLHCHEQMSYF